MVGRGACPAPGEKRSGLGGLCLGSAPAALGPSAPEYVEQAAHDKHYAHYGH